MEEIRRQQRLWDMTIMLLMMRGQYEALPEEFVTVHFGPGFVESEALEGYRLMSPGFRCKIADWEQAEIDVTSA